MRRAIVLFLVIQAALLTGLLPAYSQDAGRPDPPPGVPARRVWEELDLSPSQRRQLMQMQRGRRVALRRTTNELTEKRRDLAALYRAYPLDEARANSLIQQIGQLEMQRMRFQLQNQIELRRILNREQFARFSALVEPRPRPVRRPVNRRAPE
jgi:Spy/CpxP family protein refolding chaperone